MATMSFKVPSIVCDGCAKTITEEILVHESDAKINVDLQTKTVSVETGASEETIKQAITAVGHTVEE
jgi:copper chaperone